MSQMINIARIMLPKVSTVCLCENDTVRQGMEAFQVHGYTAVPVISQEGKYLGSVTEGDFWRHMCRVGTTDRWEMEKYRIRDIFRPDFCEALPIEADVQTTVEIALRQNFIPIVDGRGSLCGIVTRQALIKYLAELALREEPAPPGHSAF